MTERGFSPCTCGPAVTDFLLERVEEEERAALKSVDTSRWSHLSSSATQWSRAVAFGDSVRLLASRVDEGRTGVERIGIMSALRVLATIYADHPDYDERWRP